MVRKPVGGLLAPFRQTRPAQGLPAQLPCVFPEGLPQLLCGLGEIEVQLPCMSGQASPYLEHILPESAHMHERRVYGIRLHLLAVLLGVCFGGAVAT